MSFRTLLKIIVTTVLLALIIWKVGWVEVREAFLQIDPKDLLIPITIAILFIVIKIFRWLILAKQGDNSLSFSTATSSLLMGMGIGLVTPGRIGEVSRALYISGGNRLELLGLAVSDKLFDLIVIVFLSLIGSFFLLDVRLFSFLVILSLASLAFFYNSTARNILIEKSLRILPFRGKFSQVAAGFGKLTPRLVTISLGLTFAAQLINLLEYHYLVEALGYTISPESILISVPLIILASVLPISISGMGVREGVAVFLLSSFGIPDSVAVNTSLMLFALTNLSPSLIGIFLILKYKISLTKSDESINS